MARRGKGKAEGEEATAFARTYEGPGPFGKLLASAGAAASVEEVLDLLRQAHGAGMGPDEAFLELFDEEPRFSSPADARRLYSNLFGLWDLIAGGGPVEPQPKARSAKQPAPAPAPLAGVLTPEFVEAAWKHVIDLPPRESERLLHRYENTQPELTEAVRAAAGEDERVLETADTLVFELWAMLDLAQPRQRIRPVLLPEFEAELATETTPEPALDAYVEEVLEESLLDDDAPLTEAQAAAAGRLARAALRSLAKAR